MMQSNDDKIDDLIMNLSSLDIDKTCDRILMESLYILCNLNDIHPLLRYLNLPKDMKRNQTLNLAYKIAIANIKGDFINICRHINNLCPLTYYAMYLYLPEIQKHALQVLSHAYNSKLLMVPSDVLQSWLCFGSRDEALSVCRHYGLETAENAVKFVKTNFKKETPIHHLQRTIPNEKNLSVEDIFTYHSENLKGEL
ncbi:unnamed protein product [Diatraea saccharalis]|uniref:SAC3/GANP/THP3 conserved domain-containing protein n=1 Tax=Diatraea saccharalis TaxID=40085 RepID=A0A9N9QU91_9NEOP|nr:unnamed protein product [Diatraea saccharalis]